MANIKSFLGAAGVAALASLAMSTAAFADDEERKFGYSITLTGVSDYLFRGISLTDDRPAFQPFIEFTYGIAYLDFWGSNVDNASGKGNPLEVDIYAGIRPVTGPVSWDIGVLYYTNPDAHSQPASGIPGGSGLDYVEFKIGASFSPIDKVTIGVTGYYAPNQGFASAETEDVEALVSYELPALAQFTPVVSAGYGYFNASSGGAGVSRADYFATGRDSYSYWNAGVKLSVDKYFMDFRYWDTDISQSEIGAATADARFLFSAGVNLP